MTDWKPIETAPRDRNILLWRNGRIDIGFWCDDKYAKNPRPYWHSITVIFYHRTSQRKFIPTHWAEIPQGPTL